MGAKYRIKDIPRGREIEGSCGHATLRLIAELHGLTYTERQIAEMLGVPQDKTLDEEFAKGLEMMGILHLGWKQLTLDQCSRILKTPGIVIGINYMAGEDNDVDNNHYAVLREVQRDYVEIADTQLRGRIEIWTRDAFEERWHYVDAEIPPNELCNWAIVTSVNASLLKAASRALENPNGKYSYLQAVAMLPHWAKRKIAYLRNSILSG